MLTQPSRSRRKTPSLVLPVRATRLSLLQRETGGRADNEQTVPLTSWLPVKPSITQALMRPLDPQNCSRNRVGSWGGEQSPQPASSSSHPGSCFLTQDPVHLGGGM